MRWWSYWFWRLNEIKCEAFVSWRAVNMLNWALWSARLMNFCQLYPAL
jgi:hypothetical protein